MLRLLSSALSSPRHDAPDRLARPNSARRRAAPPARPSRRGPGIASHPADKPSPAPRERGVSVERFQFVDEAGDDAEALGPEGGVGGVEAEGGQEFAVAQGAAGAQQGEV